MIKKMFWGCAILAFLSWSACSCPPDEQMGELSLGTVAEAFLSYDGSETLIFVDELGGELRFMAARGKEVKTDPLCYRTTCTEAKFNSPSSCEYYAAESNRYSFFSEDNEVVIDLLLYSDVYDYGTAEFYDALQVGFSFGNPSVTGFHILEARFSGTFELSQLNISDFFVATDTLILNNKTFTDVLVYEEGSLTIYIQPELGVIGFENADHSWVIQE